MNSFKIESKEEFFKLLDCNEESTLNVIKNKGNGYSKYRLNKKNGYRTIFVLEREHPLRRLQKNLNSKLFENILFPDCVYGFCKHKSYFDFLVPHISNNKKRYYLRLDICTFFDSINIDDIYESLSYYISDTLPSSEKDDILKYMVEIVTINNHTVQGAITSPTISNLIFRSLDIRIEKYCEKLGIKYTRYADDMLFSSNTSYIHNYKFTNAIQAIIKDKGFKLNYSKSLKFKNQISINGYVISTDIHLSRKKLSSINTIIYTLNRSFPDSTNKQTISTYRNQLAGYRAYLIQSNRYISDKQKKNYIQNKIQTIEELILKCCT